MSDLTFHEANEPGTVRDANQYLEDYGYSSLRRITGYYGDQQFSENTFVPSVLVFRADCPVCADPNRETDCADCETCGGTGDLFTYFPGYRATDFQGPQEGLFDMSEPSDDAAAAARDAHHIAEREAERESEYQEKERARTEAMEMLPEEIAASRHTHSKLIGAIVKFKDGSYDNAICTRDRAVLRRRVAKSVARIRELRSQYDFT